MPTQENNENSRDGDRRADESEERINRTFKKKFHDLCGMLSGNKIQALTQIWRVDTLEEKLSK